MAWLRKIILFEQASDDFRHSLCDAVVPVEYARGATVFKQGQAGRDPVPAELLFLWSLARNMPKS